MPVMKLPTDTPDSSKSKTGDSVDSYAGQSMGSELALSVRSGDSLLQLSQLLNGSDQQAPMPVVNLPIDTPDYSKSKTGDLVDYYIGQPMGSEPVPSVRSGDNPLQQSQLLNGSDQQAPMPVVKLPTDTPNSSKSKIGDSVNSSDGQSIGSEPVLLVRSDCGLQWLQLLTGSDQKAPMPVVKLPTDTPDSAKSKTGDSLNSYAGQSIGSEPVLLARSGDNPLQWIQLLNGFNQQDPAARRSMTPVKMLKCDKCSRPFCSELNYRRHILMHRKSLLVDKEWHKKRALLGTFWDKLSLESAKEIVSIDDETLEDVPGSNIKWLLKSFVRKACHGAFPLQYVNSGFELLDITESEPGSLPIPSQKLFGILDIASEGTFLYGGTTESVHKFIFDRETEKLGTEAKNLIASTSFLIEQKLVTEWIADKEAESLRCQKLLVEEEETAQRRQAKLLEKKKQKKFRQNKQKARKQVNEENSELEEATVLILDTPIPSETTKFSVSSESISIFREAQVDYPPSLSPPLKSTLIQKDTDVEPQSDLRASGRELREFNSSPWQVQTAQRDGNAFHTGQDLQLTFTESQQLLIEEEENAQRRQAKLFEKKKQKKLRQKKQKAKKQVDEESADLEEATGLILDSPISSETTKFSVSADSSSIFTEAQRDVCQDLQLTFTGLITDKEAETLRCQKLLVEEEETAQKREAKLLERKGQKKYHQKKQKAKKQVDEESAELEAATVLMLDNPISSETTKFSVSLESSSIFTEAQTAPTHGHTTGENCEVIIGSISVPLENSQQQTEPPVADTSGHVSRSEIWRPMDRQGTVVGDGNGDSTEDTARDGSERMVLCDKCRRPCISVENANETWTDSQTGFSTKAAKDFLQQRWKDAIAGDHVVLVLTPERETLDEDTENEYQVKKTAPDGRSRTILGNAENLQENVAC